MAPTEIPAPGLLQSDWVKFPGVKLPAKEPRFTDKVVVVAGGSSGLGGDAPGVRSGGALVAVDIDGAAPERTVNNSGKARAYVRLHRRSSGCRTFSTVDADLGRWTC